MLYFKEWLILVLLVLVVAGSMGDMYFDFLEGASRAHIVVEAVLVVTSSALIAMLSLGIWHQRRSIRRLKIELQSAPDEKVLGPDERSPTVESLLSARHGLAVVVKSQFEEWGLTQTEKEVAMLLLKGLSFKEIAAVRETAEKTVRQQASSIYRKAGVPGRHAFSGWFIEDLF